MAKLLCAAVTMLSSAVAASSCTVGRLCTYVSMVKVVEACLWMSAIVNRVLVAKKSG